MCPVQSLPLTKAAQGWSCPPVTTFTLSGKPSCFAVYNTELKRHIAFSDYLRNHQDYRKKYEKIKKEAARKFPHDIDSYIKYKSSIIDEILEKKLTL